METRPPYEPAAAAQAANAEEDKKGNVLKYFLIAFALGLLLGGVAAALAAPADDSADWRSFDRRGFDHGK